MNLAIILLELSISMLFEIIQFKKIAYSLSGNLMRGINYVVVEKITVRLIHLKRYLIYDKVNGVFT